MSAANHSENSRVPRDSESAETVSTESRAFAPLEQSATRRGFLRGTAWGMGGLAASGSQLGWLAGLPSVSAHEAQRPVRDAGLVEKVEPVVKLIEQSQRSELLEKIAAEIRGGRSYREILAALLLAGVRNVQPRPSVGFKFHCVLVVNSCHLASLAGPDQDRWLPIFWALDYFKSSQADEARRSGWRLQPVNEQKVPAPEKARQAFLDAMDGWDEMAADAATAGIVRSLGATEVFNLFARYAARDYRSIGHKAIYLANAWRTLQVIGWEFAEPVLRSLSFALLNHSGEPNPAQSDLAPDRPWRSNIELAQKLPVDWQQGELKSLQSSELMSVFREGSAQAAGQVAAEMLTHGVSAQSLWDHVFVGAGELLMRQPGIIGLHSLTTANAMHYLWRNVQEPALRKQLMLQACSFNPLFRGSAAGRGQLRADSVDRLEPTATRAAGREALDEILADVSQQPRTAAAKLRNYLAKGGSPNDFVDAARRLLFVKGRDAHDYKFSSAVLEDYYHVSPAQRDVFMALSVFNLKGSGDRNSGLLDRTRAAFRST